jgi:hypothetical protein
MMRAISFMRICEAENTCATAVADWFCSALASMPWLCDVGHHLPVQPAWRLGAHHAGRSRHQQIVERIGTGIAFGDFDTGVVALTDFPKISRQHCGRGRRTSAATPDISGLAGGYSLRGVNLGSQSEACISYGFTDSSNKNLCRFA